MKENKISEKVKILNKKSEEISETTEMATEQAKNVVNQLLASADEKPTTLLKGILCFCVGAAIGAASVACIKQCFSK